MKVIIVGGVAGGASAAARLRRLDENAEILILERGAYISYANCGLPYYVGGDILDANELLLQTTNSFWQRFRVKARVFNEVVSIDAKAHTVTVRVHDGADLYTEEYDKLILSPGAKPVQPPIKGAQGEDIFYLRTVPDSIHLREWINRHHPKHIVIIGGGFIGVEMAESLTNLGIAVTIVEMGKHLLAPFDYEMACDVHNYLRNKGVNLLLGEGVHEISRSDKGVNVHTKSEIIAANAVFFSVGVRPESEIASAAGIAVNARGCILVNENMCTSIEDIYAVGDAIEVSHFVNGAPTFIPLAGPANKQGRIAADHICGIDSAYHGTQGSSIVKIFDMTAACTGLNERALQEAHIDYDKVYNFSASHASYYPGAQGISIKTLFEKESGKVLGAQLIGYDGVDKRCDVMATAIRAGMSVFDLAELELCYAPPFSSAKDPVNMAGFTAENLLSGRVTQFHWNEVATILANENGQFIDVRTQQEYDGGHIVGFKNIPLDELRERLSELDNKKTIYIHCQSGTRSYLAYCILKQKGFSCHHLAGGYRIYASVEKNEI